jgi:hypothetical protein
VGHDSSADGAIDDGCDHDHPFHDDDRAIDDEHNDDEHNVDDEHDDHDDNVDHDDHHHDGTGARRQLVGAASPPGSVARERV